MPNLPTQKRLVDPAGWGEPEFFAEHKRRRKPERTEPLPGTKLTLPSADDGQLEQLFTVHDSTTIPKPSGGRKLVMSEDADHLKDVLKGRKLEPESVRLMMVLEGISMGMAGFLLLLQSLIFKGGDHFSWAPFFAVWCMITLHVCAFFGQCFSAWKNPRIWRSLAATYAGWAFWMLMTALP